MGKRKQHAAHCPCLERPVCDQECPACMCGYRDDRHVPAGKEPPPTARERRLLRLLKRCREPVEHLWENYGGPEDELLLRAIDRELKRGDHGK